MKTDLLGDSVKCCEYILRHSAEIEKRETEKTFGNEKGKLVIQPVGELCIDFLMAHFSEIFDYGYTKKMEEDLDKVAQETVCKNMGITICKSHDDNIKRMIKQLNKISKQVYSIDSEHELCFSKYGPAIRRLTTGDTGVKVEYMPINKELKIDMERLKKNGYTLEELLDKTLGKGTILGKYEDVDVLLRTGPFGPYLEWGTVKKTIVLNDTDNQHLGQYTLNDAILVLCKDHDSEKSSIEDKFVLRTFSAKCTIRRGKFGMYVHYMDASTKKPQFFSLKKFKGDYTTCEPCVLVEWIYKTFNAKITL